MSDARQQDVESASPDGKSDALEGLREEDEAFLPSDLQYLPETDPCFFLCCCQFKRLGHNYILREAAGPTDDGRSKTQTVIVGPHWIGVVITAGIILASTVAFVYQQGSHMSWYSVLLSFFFCGVTLHYLYLTTCLDPGIVKSSRSPSVESTCTTELSEADEEGQRMAATLHTQQDTSGTFCDICNLTQPPLAEHCNDCGVCIEELDHHCPWMGKCIGKKNMWAFKRFNISWLLYVVFVLCISISNIELPRNLAKAADNAVQVSSSVQHFRLRRPDKTKPTT